MRLNARKLLWALPLIAIAFGAVVSLLFFRTTTQLLDGLGAMDSPTLSQSQTLIFELNHISDGLKSGVAAADKALVDTAFQRADKFRGQLTQLGATPGQSSAAVEIGALFEAYVKAAKAVAAALLDGKGDDPGAAAQAMQTAIKALDTKLDDHKKAAQKALDDHIAQARLLTQHALVANLLASLLTLLLSLGVSWISVRGLMRQLGGAPEEATRIVQRIAGGDLSQPVRLKDNNSNSLLHAMRAMQEQLARVIGDVRQAVQQVHTAADDISGGNQALSERSTRQASSLQLSASRITELTHSVLANADSAERAHQLARRASDQADQGNRAVADAVGTMGEISDRARKIVEITTLIDGIAFQTNILALNAAVEAARAGEQGRGFAVVAGEVRTLAHRAGAAAKDIKALIDDSAARIEAGAKHVNAAGQAMNELVDSVKQVGQHIGTISSASAQQRTGIEEVNQAVAELGNATEQNQTLVEQAGEASRALQAVARQLGEVVGQFNVARGAHA